MNSLVKVNTSKVNGMAVAWIEGWKAWTVEGLARYKLKLLDRNATMSRWERWMTGRIDVEAKMRSAKRWLPHLGVMYKIAAIERATQETNVKSYIEADVYAALCHPEDYFGEPYEV